MFWKKFYGLCLKNNTKANRVTKELGLSAATATSWKNGAIPREDTIQKVADYFGVPVEYFTAEKEQKEKPLIRIHEGELLSSARMRMVPVFDSVSAGFGAEALEDVAEYIPLYFENLEEAERTFCINVKGNSMSPKIEDGDIIQICKQDSIDSGKIGVVLIDGTDALVKQIWLDEKGVTLHSFNPFYPDMFFEPSEAEHVKVVGVVKKIIKTL